MTSERLFVWAWLPGSSHPVPAGALDAAVGDELVTFVYADSYLSRPDAIALYEPELPLRRGAILPTVGQGFDRITVAGCIRDAGPDSWGQRALAYRRTTASFNNELLSDLAESSSDRVGALDFQRSATDYVARDGSASFEELLAAADAIESGEPLTAELYDALLHGTSIGGARPKAVVRDVDDTSMVVKFSAARDRYPVVKAEAAAMELARRVGINVAATRLIDVAGRDTLLVDRFDRGPNGERRMIVSALTVLGLSDVAGRHAKYSDLADQIRRGFTSPNATLRELFTRIVVNIALGNTDDHARNHAAFWDGRALTLTPAFDICPQLRSGGWAAQAMDIGRGPSRLSRFATCVANASIYHLDRRDAEQIVDHVVSTIRSQWREVADSYGITSHEREMLERGAILHPFAFETNH